MRKSQEGNGELAIALVQEVKGKKTKTEALRHKNGGQAKFKHWLDGCEGKAQDKTDFSPLSFYFSLHFNEANLNRIYIFLLRIVLGAFFAILMMRFFYPEAKLVYTGALGVYLVAMAYMFEKMKKR